MKGKFKILLGVAGMAALLVLIWFVFQSQWNMDGRSRYMNVSFDHSGLNYVTAAEENDIYTYHIGQCAYALFLDGSRIDLKTAFENGMSISAFTQGLKSAEKSGIMVYEAEEYQIMAFENKYVVAPLDAEVQAVADELDEVEKNT